MKPLSPPLACLLASVVIGMAARPTRAAEPTGESDQWVRPAPPYPVAARMQHISGRGTLHVRTDATGRVVEAHMDPSTGSPLLDEDAVRFAVAHWHGPPNQSHATALDYRAPVGLPPEAAAYQKAVQAAVAPHWTDLCRLGGEGQVPPGSATLEFEISPAGQAGTPREPGKGGDNPALVTLAKATLGQTRLPPMPASMQGRLTTGA